MKTIAETLRAQADFIEQNAEWIKDTSFFINTDGGIDFCYLPKGFAKVVVARFSHWTWTRESDRWNKESINWIGRREDGLRLILSGAESRTVPKLQDLAPEPLVFA